MASFEATHIKSVLADAVDATGTQGEHDISDFSYGSVQAAGAGTWSVQLQVSNDGDNWVDFGAAIGAAGITEVNLYSGLIRADCTITTGAVTVTLVAKR